MNLFIVSVAAAALVSGQGTAARADTPEEQKIVATLSLLSRAMIEKDLPALQRILHGDLTYGHSGGLVQSKAQVLCVGEGIGSPRVAGPRPPELRRSLGGHASLGAPRFRPVTTPT